MTSSFVNVRRLWLCAVCSGLAVLSGCGGGTSSSAPRIVSNSCSIQLEALRPPCPPGVTDACVTPSCTTSDPTGTACGTMSQNNISWNSFQNVVGSAAVGGVNLAVPWTSVETSQGGYDFSALDPQVDYYQSHYAGTKVNLMFIPISYSSNGNNPTGGVNYFTPSYVFTTQWAQNGQVVAGNGGTVPGPLDVVTCASSGYAGNGSADSGYPVVYEAPFYVAYHNFIKAVIVHYNSGFPNIGYMRFGLSVGDETDAYCTAEMQVLPSPNTFQGSGTWEPYIAMMSGFEKSQNPSFLIMNSLNSLDTNPGPTLPVFEAKTAFDNGFGFGSNGWQASDIQASANGGVGCTSDWCQLFNQYTGEVPLELQTATPSDPSGGGTTGSLVPLIPTAVQNHATILELSLSDLLTAFDPSYNPQFFNAYNTSVGSACSQ